MKKVELLSAFLLKIFSPPMITMMKLFCCSSSRNKATYHFPTFSLVFLFLFFSLQFLLHFWLDHSILQFRCRRLKKLLSINISWYTAPLPVKCFFPCV